MKFKLIKEPTEELFFIFKDYCLISKPLSFCESPSIHMRLLKIKQYFNNLFLHYDCFISLENDKIVCFFCLEKKNNIATIIIAFGLHSKITFKKMSEHFIDFKEFYKKLNPEIKKFNAEINRTHKLDSYLKFIKRYLNPSKIELDKEPIMVYFD
jgi:hypothetical protein